MTASGGLVVGIDAGGTTTRVAVLDTESGTWVAEAEGTSSPDGGLSGDASVRGCLRDAAQARQPVRAACAGVARVTRGDSKRRWEAELTALFPHARVVAVEPDYVVAFHGATGGVAGVAVVAGTGSVAYGEGGRGASVRVGGRGWEFGDEGSGGWLTTEVVRRTLRALDGTAPATPLTNAACVLLGTHDPAAFAEAARQRAQTGGRGFLVPFALERARAGDDLEAKNLFVGAAGWLGLLAKTVAARLELATHTPDFVVATVGGLWEAGDLLLDPFRTVVARWMPDARIVPPVESPVRGAARRAAAAALRDSPPSAAHPR